MNLISNNSGFCIIHESYYGEHHPTLTVKEDVKEEVKDIAKEEVDMFADDFDFGDSMNFGE